MKKPLEGLRVVEMGTYVAVPKAARMMADWGAEVIKIEPPSGDIWRVIGKTFMMPYEEDNSAYFQPENMNKKSLCLNLKTEEGKEAMLKLLETADIFLTNTRLRGLAKLGFDYDTLKDKFPRLIMAQFSAFGEKGPDKDRPGFDVAAFWARSGALVEWSLEESIPAKPHPGFGDGTVGSALLAGIMAALYQRERTGKGDKIETSLFGTALFYNSAGVLLGQPQFGHKYPKKRLAPTGPLVPLYKSKDGDWLLISEPKWDQKYTQILEVLGIPEYIDDPRFYPITEARKHLPEIIAILDEAFSKVETKVLLERLEAIDVVHEKLANPADLYKDPQAWANGYLKEVTLQCGEKVVMPTNPVRFGSMEEPETNLAPYLGQDSAEILKELGYTAEEIRQMAEQNAIIVR